MRKILASWLSRKRTPMAAKASREAFARGDVAIDAMVRRFARPETRRLRQRRLIGAARWTESLDGLRPGCTTAAPQQHQTAL